ncbi:DUF4232 domain-containing protein [Streptomyces sp. NPDC012637]|uniref:DUF4232 domain-containing protein n=1 Tax=Streptomyces sp. NPDC012637 TaxID=3364842 RepID=UPI0036ECFAA4
MNTGWKSYAVGAAVVAGLLTATACGPNGSGGSEGAGEGKPSDRPSATSPTGPTSAPPSATGSAGPSATASAKPTGSGGGSGAVADCAVADLGVSAVKEPADSKESRHLLITVQNAGDASCNLHAYPYVRLGADARTTVPVIKDSDPDPGRPVTIAPGEEAYAALLVAGGKRDEYEARSITLTLQGRKPGTKAGKPVDVPMPVPTLYADDGQLVTYWTTAEGAALDFIMSK